MVAVIRHGGGSHFVRPDRVTRTGVIPSMVGYNPSVDVMSVTNAFTQVPMSPQMQGLGYTPQLMGRTPQLMGRGYPQLMDTSVQNLGWFQQLWLRFQAWRTANHASALINAAQSSAAAVAALPAGSAVNGLRGLGGGPMYVPNVNGNDIAKRQTMLAMMAGHHMPPEWAPTAMNTIAGRWNGARHR
jgi:hypothetical protein